jgi:hypothetical protein
MKEFDLNHDNHITFEEFEKIFNDWGSDLNFSFFAIYQNT